MCAGSRVVNAMVMAHCWKLHSSEIVALDTFIETVGCYRCQFPVSISAIPESCENCSIK